MGLVCKAQQGVYENLKDQAEMLQRGTEITEKLGPGIPVSPEVAQMGKPLSEMPFVG